MPEKENNIKDANLTIGNEFFFSLFFRNFCFRKYLTKEINC